MTDTPLTAEACEECLDRRWGSVHGETCPHHPLSPWESTQRHIAALTERAKTAELESTWQQENDRLRERIRVADARVAELEAAGKLLATQGREMATGLCSDTREVGATGVCVACQVRMVRYLEVWRAALEGKR